MFGPGYEELYRDAQEKYNIKFVRGRLSEASENISKQLVIKVEDTLVGKPLKMTLDLMVLMIGMEASRAAVKQQHNYPSACRPTVLSVPPIPITARI